MRRVTLPPDCPRGGVLTEGTVLVVTSNPDRTSPVKRGLFVLNAILGSPTPPPPPNIPALEASEKHFHDHEPTLRETLSAHRDKPECAACHARLDPVGLAFENFNAMGMWREQERGQTIEAGGRLITGETFQNVRELKHILADEPSPGVLPLLDREAAHLRHRPRHGILRHRDGGPDRPAVGGGERAFLRAVDGRHRVGSLPARAAPGQRRFFRSARRFPQQPGQPERQEEVHTMNNTHESQPGRRRADEPEPAALFARAGSLHRPAGF